MPNSHVERLRKREDSRQKGHFKKPNGHVTRAYIAYTFFSEANNMPTRRPIKIVYIIMRILSLYALKPQSVLWSANIAQISNPDLKRCRKLKLLLVT